MSSISERAARRPQTEKREVKYVVRAPDSNNRGRWVTVGVAFERKNGEDGFSGAVSLRSWDFHYTVYIHWLRIRADDWRWRMLFICAIILIFVPRRLASSERSFGG